MFPLSLSHHLLKIRLRVLADRADEIVRQLFALPLISADEAAPDCFALRSFGGRLRLRLDVVLIVLVGTG